MGNTISRDSSLIRNASNSLVSFYAKQPVLAYITTVILPAIAVIGFIFYRKNIPFQDSYIERYKENIVKGYLKGAKEWASKIDHAPTRDRAYEKISQAYRKRLEHSKALEAAGKIVTPGFRNNVLRETRQAISISGGPTGT